jgi:hypothetical protein
MFLHMMGAEIAADAHYDEYMLNFTSFKPVPENNQAAFAVPSECTEDSMQQGARPTSLALASLLPNVWFCSCPCPMLLQLPCDFSTYSQKENIFACFQGMVRHKPSRMPAMLCASAAAQH